MLTAEWTYLRFHYGEDGGRYSRAQLEQWAERIRSLTADGAGAHIYFNNDWQGYAIENARELRSMLAIAPRLS